MAKEDFCFTYYDGDAARDMAHMNRLERGAYTDIIISQRKFGRLTLLQLKKILGKDFDECWTSVELVLIIDDEKYYIEWLENSINKKKTHSKFQSENGKKGGRPAKKNPNESELKPNESQMKAELKPAFDLAFQNESEIKPLGNGYGYGYGNKDEEDKEGAGEKEETIDPNCYLPKMLETFCLLNKSYKKDNSMDLPSLLQIATFINDGKMPQKSENAEELLSEWESVVDFVVSDNFYKSFSIKQINNNIQAILLKKHNNGNNSGFNKKGDPGKQTIGSSGFGRLSSH